MILSINLKNSIILIILSLLLGTTSFLFIEKFAFKELDNEIKIFKSKVHKITNTIDLEREKYLVIIQREQLSTRIAFYTFLVQLLGGLFFLVTATLAIRNARTSEQKQISERFSKAIEQLNVNGFNAVAGGYVLEQITKDSKAYYWPVIEILTSYVRNRSIETYSVSPEIQEILTILGRCLPKSSNKSRDLDLSESRLSRYCFRDVCFEGATFRNSELNQSIFIKANFVNTNFDNAYLVNIKCSDIVLFTNSTFVKANLMDSAFQSSKFDYCDFRDAKLNGCNLISANFRNANLTNANLSDTNLTNTIFCRAILNGVIFSQNTDLSNANFIDVVGLSSKTVIKSKNWYKSKYDRDFFVRTDFCMTELSNIVLSKIDFSNSDFSSAIISNVDFSESNLSNCIFEDTKIDKIKIKNADIKNAVFINASGLKAHEIMEAKNWEYASFSPNLKKELENISKYN